MQLCLEVKGKLAFSEKVARQGLLLSSHDMKGQETWQKGKEASITGGNRFLVLCLAIVKTELCDLESHG